MDNNKSNNNKKKIYIVTEGCYSDYGIVAVFDTREKAQKYIDNTSYRCYFESDEYHIEEYDLNKDIPPKPTRFRIEGMMYYEDGYLSYMCLEEAEKDAIIEKPMEFSWTDDDYDELRVTGFIKLRSKEESFEELKRRARKVIYDEFNAWRYNNIRTINKLRGGKKRC